MTHYLLAAEADQIQDLLFRASHLREVVGGSQLLMRFGDDTQPGRAGSALHQLLARYTPTPQIVTAGGGSFRLLFEREDQAHDFGRKLAELYRLTTGGSLSVAQPVAYTTDYQQASEAANRGLRQAKRGGSAGQTTAHLPFTALCASCGTALALEHDKRVSQETREQYLCQFCLAKGAARSRSARPNEFLQSFYEKVVGADNLSDYQWPGHSTDDTPDPTEDVARLDPRRYVAYLVADGNNLGKIFGKCDQAQASDLSQTLLDTLRNCLAEPTQMLMAAQPEPRDKNFIPVLPLILGGDDLFALLPAPWALDFARAFCEIYETAMQSLAAQYEVEPPTMAAAVVICKASYPYYLAHQAGEIRLTEAKKMAKQLALSEQIHSSVVNFEIIISSQLPTSSKTGNGFRPTLRPYWVQPGVPAKWGLPLATLLAQREPLAVLPHRRHAQLRRYFDQLRGLDNDQAQQRLPRLEQLLSRIGRSPENRERVEQVLAALGGSPAEGWRRTISRYHNPTWEGHGLPDLLDAWDFSYKIDQPRQTEEE